MRPMRHQSPAAAARGARRGRRRFALTRTVVGRLLYLAVVLLCVSFLVFLLLDLLPGDPAQSIADASGIKDPGAIATIRHSLGLDHPFFIRFFSWLGGVLHGNLGQSYQSHQSVAAAIAHRAPVSFQLILTVEVISLVVAIPLAVYVAVHRDGIADRLLAAATFTLQAVPSFIIALVLILVLAVNLKWLPTIGYTPIGQGFLQSERSLLIPALSLAAGLIPVYVRVLRRSLIETLAEEFVLVARAVGMPRRAVLYRYALKPSLPALTTVVGVNFGTLIGGTVVVEIICGIPGVGSLLLTSIQNGDYLVVQGVILLAATVYVLANFAVDLVHLILDPRVRS